MNELLLGPDVRSLEPTDYVEYIRSLYIKPPSKTATEVDGINISWGKKKIFRIKRDPKFITYAEIEILAKQFNYPIDAMYREFRKRKVEVRRD